VTDRIDTRTDGQTLLDLACQGHLWLGAYETGRTWREEPGDPHHDDPDFVLTMFEDARPIIHDAVPLLRHLAELHGGDGTERPPARVADVLGRLIGQYAEVAGRPVDSAHAVKAAIEALVTALIGYRELIG
jgi:hypothetical protein